MKKKLKSLLPYIIGALIGWYLTDIGNFIIKIINILWKN
jgi:hypothetical protein